MPPVRSPLALVLLVATLIVTAPAASAQDDAAGNETTLPTPGRDVPVMDVEANVGSGPRVVLSWSPVEDAASYEVYVNADVQSPPEWVRVDGDVNEQNGNVTFVDESPPDPMEGREDVSYAVVALDDAGEPVAEGRVAAEPSGAPIPYRGPFDGSGTDTEQESVAATTTGTLLGILALAVIAIAVLAFIGIKRRGD